MEEECSVFVLIWYKRKLVVFVIGIVAIEKCDRSYDTKEEKGGHPLSS